MNRRQLLVGSAAGLVAGTLARIADADVVCLMRWIKPQHPAFDQIARMERRWCLTGTSSAHFEGEREVVDDFRIFSLICGERR